MTDRKKKKQKRCLQNAETKRRNFRSNNGHSFRPSFLASSLSDGSHRTWFRFQILRKTATKKKCTYLGRDLLLPRHSCRGLSCRSASSAVPERSVLVATKVQQEKVCSKLQPVRITWTLDRRRQQQKKKNRADGSAWWIFALVLLATSDCGRQ